MIKFTRYVSISALVPSLFIISYFLGKLKEISILFIIISIHECCHVFAALMFRIKIDEVVISPIGLVAKIKYGLCNLGHECIIALAGPFSNILMAVSGHYINSYYLDNSEFMSFFVLCNISLAVLNLLPVLPLDGGRIFKGFLLNMTSYNNSIKIFDISAKIISLFLIVLGVYQILNSLYNLSLLSIGIFLFILSDKEVHHMQYEMLIEIISKRMKFEKQKIINIAYIACSEDTKLIEIIKNFYKNRYHIIQILNPQMKFLDEIREEEIFDFLELYGCEVTVGEVSKIKNAS